MGDRQLHSSRVQLCTNGNGSAGIAAFENGFLRMQEKGAQHILKLSAVRCRFGQLRREVKNHCDVPPAAVISPRIGQLPDCFVEIECSWREMAQAESICGR